VAGGAIGVILVQCDPATGDVMVRPIEGFDAVIHAVDFSPDGRKVVSGGLESTLRVWDVQAGIDISGPLSMSGAICAVAFSSDGKRIAAGGYFGVDIIDAKSGIRIRELRYPSLTISHVSFVAFSAKGQAVISCADEKVSVWNLDTGTLVAGPSKRHAEGTLITAFNANSGAGQCAVAPNGKWIAERNGKSIKVWDSKTGVLAATYKGHASNVRSVAFSPDSKRVVSTSHNNTGTIQVNTLE